MKVSDIVVLCIGIFVIGVTIGMGFGSLIQDRVTMSSIRKKGFHNINDNIKITGKIEVRE